MMRRGPVRSMGIVVLGPVLASLVEQADDPAAAASSRLSLAVAALVGLAVVIAVSTVIFWRSTRPDSLNVGEVGIRWIQPETSPFTSAPQGPSTPPGATATDAPRRPPSATEPTRTEPTRTEPPRTEPSRTAAGSTRIPSSAPAAPRRPPPPERDAGLFRVTGTAEHPALRPTPHDG